MTFLSDLARLREAATKGHIDKWVVGREDQYWPMFIGINTPPHYQSIQLVSRMEGGEKCLGRERAELIAYLVNHSEAIEELVRAAEQLRRWDGKNPSSGIYEDFCQALEKLNGSENET